MMNTLATIALSPVTCCNCGVTFGLESAHMALLKTSHDWWYCPNGHRQHWPQKNEAERLRDELAREKHLREQASARVTDLYRQKASVERRLSATRGVVTRHKNKIAAGRCPCCSTQFKDLKRHMAKQHPNWNPEREAEVRADA